MSFFYLEAQELALCAQSERQRAREIVRRARVTREMTAAERKLAAEWDALPTVEKDKVEQALRRVQIEPPLSELIHEMRA